MEHLEEDEYGFEKGSQQQGYEQEFDDTSDRNRYSRTRNRNDEDEDQPINWAERIVQMVDKFGFMKIIITIFLVFLTYFGYHVISALNYEKIADYMITKRAEEHEKSSQIRANNNPKIMLSMTKLLYELKADRVSIMEMHNGKENPTNLPFIYCDMTYEETQDMVPYIADEYENLNMSKYTFPAYVFKKRYFIGSIEELYEIDRKLATRLEANKIGYFGIVVLRNEKEIGYLMVSYQEKPEHLEAHDIHVVLSDYAQELSFLLDLGSFQYKQKNVK